MTVPLSLVQGDRVTWTAEIPTRDEETATGVTYWFRTNTAGAGVSSVGIIGADGTWTFELTGVQTAGMVVAQWYWQAVATYPSGDSTFEDGSVQVLQSFAYSGTPGAVDQRSQAEQDLASVEEAIRVLSTGAQSYTIGTAAGGRTFTRPMLAQLIAWRDRLIQQVSAEQIANGQTRRNRRILIDFD